MSFKLPRELTDAVTGWFSENGRDLPWRREPDPYRVWLSEIMLQQTRIEAVIPYYFRFLEAFPSVSSLAEAEDGRLYKLWEGLGYYSRARNLKKAAIILARDYGGALPPDVKLLRSLPGIGDYTAGAVASIAFGLPEPAVDGNVLRVLSRVSLYGGDVMLPAAKKEAAEALREIYPGGRAAAMMTEGLMEIGEVLCVPNGEPLCASCPLRELCQAEARGEALNYPVRSPRKERRIEERTVFLIRAPGGRFLLRRRPAEGLLGGMWEFPSVPGSCAEEDLPAALETVLPGAEPVSFASVGEAKHLFTHVEWRMKGILAELAETPPLPPADRGSDPDAVLVFAAPEEIAGKYAVPSAFRAWKKIALGTG